MDSFLLIASFLVQVIGSVLIVIWIYKKPKTTKMQLVYKKRQLVTAMVLWPVCSVTQIGLLFIIQPNISQYIESIFFSWAALIFFSLLSREMRGDFMRYWPSGERKDFDMLQKNTKELQHELWFSEFYKDSRYMNVMSSEPIGRILEKDGIVEQLKDLKERQGFIDKIKEEHRREMLSLYGPDFGNNHN